MFPLLLLLSGEVQSHSHLWVQKALCSVISEYEITGWRSRCLCSQMKGEIFNNIHYLKPDLNN